MANSSITSDKQEPKKRQIVYIEKLSEAYHGKIQLNATVYASHSCTFGKGVSGKVLMDSSEM